MADLTIWHNPRCSKSRQTLELIENSGKSVIIRKYLEDSPNSEELKQVLQLLGIPARQLIRKGEEEYKSLGLNDQSLSEEDIINAMVKAPKLIERPVVISTDKAVLGRPPENVNDLL